MIGGSRKRHNEASGEEILTNEKVIGGILLSPLLVVDEHVGKRGRRVSRIGTLVEKGQKLSDLLVDRRWVLILVDLSAIIDRPPLGVDGAHVGLVIDKQKRDAFDIRPSFLVPVPGNGIIDPLQQVSQHSGVLLDHEDNRVATRGDAEIAGDRRLEIIRQRGHRINPPVVQVPDEMNPHRNPDLPPRILGIHSVGIAQNTLFNSVLRLNPQALGETGEHDHNLVTGIKRLVDETDVVGCLARLDETAHKATTIPCTIPGGISHESENPVRGAVQP